MRSLLPILLFLSANCLAQSFSSHTIVLTPSQRPHVGFDPDEYRLALFRKYRPKFKSETRLNEFIEMETAEKRMLYGTNHVYTNWPEATSYLEKLLEYAVPEAAADKKVKLHLVREPSLNASMAEDGTMLLHVGTLAELESEAELLAIFGHEFGHYVHQHSFERYNKLVNMKNQNKVAAHVGMFGGVLLQVANMKRVSADVQAEERESDMMAVKLFKNRGLAPSAMTSLFQRFDNIYRKYESRVGYRRPLIYFRTHPEPDKRLEYCAREFTGEERASDKKFVVNSLQFVNLRQKAVDECVYLYFEDKQYGECLELAYKQHLFYPEDEFYLFFIIECLRREQALTPGFETKLFVTGNYSLDEPDRIPVPPDTIMSKMADRDAQVYRSVFYQMRGPIFNFSPADMGRVKVESLISNDTIDFLTNAEAFEYFVKKLQPACGAHQFSLRCLDRKIGAEKRIEFTTDLERRYSVLFPELDLLETPHEKMLIYLGGVSVSSETGGAWDELGATEDDELAKNYYNYFGTTAAFNEQMSFDQALNFDDQFILWGSLRKARSIGYANDIFRPAKPLSLRQLDPELYFTAHKYRCNRFAMVDIRVVRDRNHQIGRKAQEWIYTLYIVDFPGNRVVKKTVRRTAGKSVKEEELFRDIFKNFKDWIAAQPR